MQYTPTTTPPPGHLSPHRTFDAVMLRIDEDLVSWNFTAFKLHLLGLSKEEQQRILGRKKESISRYRMTLMRLEMELARREQERAKKLMGASGDAETLERIEQDILSL